MALEDYMLPCPSKKFFGIECFGCGSQRALALILKGDFIGAFFMFPAIYPLLIFILLSAFNFIDSKRNYNKAIIFFAIISTLMMIISYFYRQLK